MQARMKNPVMIVPSAMEALQQLGAAAEGGSLSSKTIALVQLRASQINGCSLCADMHARIMKRSGETDERLFAVATWRDAPYFTEAERAALALAEAVTRVGDRDEAVSDPVWNEAARHHDEPAMARLLLAIATINVWNRLNVATRQVAGSVKWEGAR